jgi:ABC-2 type transport system ATP-binding protein
MHAIEIKDLTREFDDFIAVDRVSFNVKEGELFGLLGPNGAGKTTIIKMLSTLLKPSSGYADVAGFNISTGRYGIRNSIGIVFQDPALDNKLTGRENLEFHSMMYGLSKEFREKRIKEVLELVELKDKADVLVENYSGGMKRRLEIARGLIHKPKVLFLDEPTLGLDAQTRRHIWDYIKKLNEEDVTIILTTHYMEEADYLCDRVAIIDFGKIVALDTPKKLKDSLGGDVISLEIQEQDTMDFEAELDSYKWVKGLSKHNGFIDLKVENADKRIPEIILLARKFNITVESVNLRRPSLEDVFLQYTGRTIREREAGHNERGREMVRMRMRR